MLTLVFGGSRRRHTHATLRVIEELANRCALALENALLYERQRLARERSEHLAERLQLAAAASGIGIWDYNVSTGVLNWDVRVRQLFGLAPDAEVTYERFLTRVHPEDRERVDRDLERRQQAVKQHPLESDRPTRCWSNAHARERGVRRRFGRTSTSPGRARTPGDKP